MITYKITCDFLMIEPFKVLLQAFPDFKGEPAEYCERFIIVTFDKPQTVADLGPSFKVEQITLPQ